MAASPNQPAESGQGQHTVPTWRRRLTEAFTQRLALKGTALLLAIVLWFIVTAKEPNQDLVDVQFAPQLEPDRVEVSGPRQRVLGMEYVVTVHVAIPATDSLPHLVDIDTTRLGLRVRPSQVKVHLVPSAPATASAASPTKS